MTINPHGKVVINLDRIVKYEPAYGVGINTNIYAIVDQETDTFATVT